MSHLPVEEIKSAFIDAITSNDLVVLSAPPGAGKSTGLPLWLVDNPDYGKIYLLQPRRMAAKSIAYYLAQQLGEPVGQTIGYRLRNETKVSKQTKIEVITEGILTQLIQQDPELSHCNLILFDEFHERSVHADLAFALARDVQTGLREDLTLVLMSATLSVERLKQQFPSASFLQSEGRSFPVEITYQPMKSERSAGFIKHNAWREHAYRVIKSQVGEHQGSILVFLPGVADIKYLAELLIDQLPNHYVLAPLYGDLDLAQQQQAIAAPQSGYKLVLATNIAETSLTIDGINLVIDCGFEKVALFNHQTLTNKLAQQPISKASAVQRAGRAGRLMAGHCIRLYSQEEFSRRNEQQISEIMQADIQPMLIEAARWGVNQLADLPLLERPNVQKEGQTWQVLIDLNIVDSQRKLTPHGIAAAELPCHPRFAHMIISAKQIQQEHQQQQLTLLACLIAAMLEERDILPHQQRELRADIHDRVLFLIHNARSGLAYRIMQQAIQLAVKAIGSSANVNEIKKLISESTLPLDCCGELVALAYPERIAKLRNDRGEFLACNGKGLSVNIDDTLAQQPFIAVAHLKQLRDRLHVQIGAALDYQRLLTWGIIKPQTKNLLVYDEQKDAIVAEQQLRIGAIILERNNVEQQLDAEQTAQMWCEKLRQKGLAFLAFSPSTQTLLLRWRWLNQFQSHLALPCVSEASLLHELDKWFMPFVGTILKKKPLLALDFSSMLLSLLDYQQQQDLNKFAPTHYVGPTGRRCEIRYQEQASPIVSLPMQEIYGQSDTPSVGDINQQQSIPLTLELLSPAGRPIQVTQNLPAFWQGSYKEVQKEMKGRYPKHYWPDDPANAQATNKTKRHLSL